MQTFLKMCSSLLVLLALCSHGFAQDVAPGYEFPATQGVSKLEYPSPNGKWLIRVIDPGQGEDGIHLYRLILTDRLGAELGSFDFMRSIDASWSKSGEELIINDYTGSNISDCLYSRKYGDKIYLSRISEDLNDVPFFDENGNAFDVLGKIINTSHFYIKCESRFDQKIVVSLSGRLDPNEEFDYKFSYDLVGRRFSILR
ncbi:hypothetical protein [Niveispirillum sp. BGYR6]|uniref:hypothetical protein n=1 Tax=Niveispirillum sp. BGYR6 TaxID=2971249 RepID=UPI0022B94942|nr:hypothetical protein [Niveispirillum sp. BGYR6]MDG5497871.1 hypothetical protein [Niveispirillum sp. BGYR6]